jgi:hypothetical protein
MSQIDYNSNGTHSRSEMVAVLGTPCDIPPFNTKSNRNSSIPFELPTLVIDFLLKVTVCYSGKSFDLGKENGRFGEPY